MTGVDPWEAQLVNQASRGGLLLKGQTLCVIEVVPAAYVMLAANEAEKAANITLVHYQPANSAPPLHLKHRIGSPRSAGRGSHCGQRATPGLRGRGGA